VKKGQKSENKNRLFSTVSRISFSFLGVAWCGSVSWCGSEGIFPKNRPI